MNLAQVMLSRKWQRTELRTYNFVFMRSFLAFFLVLSCFTISKSQVSISGFVYDHDSLPFENIGVNIIGVDSIIYTDSNGFYKINNIMPGTYAMSFDYAYDVLWKKVEVGAQSVEFNLFLDRRVEFDEVIIKTQRWGEIMTSNQEKLSQTDLQNQSNDIPYLLSKIVSQTYSSDAGNGVGYTGMRIRGVDPSHVQISLNGIPFNDPESSLSFFVDLPDIASSIDEASVSRGFVSSRAGVGGFGTAVDFNLNKLSLKPFALLSTIFGSYGLLKSSVILNSGLLENKFNVEGRLSYIQSNGFIERSHSKLKSLFISASKVKANSSLKLNLIYGNEITGQAWNGVPESYLHIDSLYRFNFAGTEALNGYYDDIDSYQQNHIQLFYQKVIKKNVDINFIFNHTFGSGFYENYKSNQDLSTYYLESSISSTADIIRQKWLRNHFLFANMFLDLSHFKNQKHLFGLSSSYYKGGHFGRVKDAKVDSFQYLKSEYYDNTGEKSEQSVYYKNIYFLTKKFQFGADLLFRFVNYNSKGLDDYYGGITISNQQFLLNPKLFSHYMFNRHLSMDISASYYEREPFRDDILRNSNVRKEQLLDFEFGLVYNRKKFNSSINFYSMNYKNQLILNGEINDVGEAVRVNVDKSYRQGLELKFSTSVLKKFNINGNLNLSDNKIINHIENIYNYDSNFAVVNIIKSQLPRANISFSPNLVSWFEIKASVFQNKKYSLNISPNYKYVGSQYLDNSNREFSKIDAYGVLNIRSELKFNIKHKHEVNLWFDINNFLNKSYTTHGWIYYYSTQQNVTDTGDPYHQSPDGHLHYGKAVYPQALRNFALGISVKIN